MCCCLLGLCVLAAMMMGKKGKKKNRRRGGYGVHTDEGSWVDDEVVDVPTRVRPAQYQEVPMQSGYQRNPMPMGGAGGYPGITGGSNRY